MKRFLSLLLALLLVCAPLGGCGVIDQQTAIQLAEQVLIAALNNASDAESSSIAAESDTEKAEVPSTAPTTSEPTAAASTDPDGSDSVIYGEWYDTPYEVAEYIHLYNELPPNYITKSEARALGWDNSKGNLWEVAEDKSIGGDHFGNYEGLLPDAAGRRWTECDVNYEGGYRGGERIVFSNDGLIYYTADHYNSFTLLYGEE